MSTPKASHHRNVFATCALGCGLIASACASHDDNSSRDASEATRATLGLSFPANAGAIKSPFYVSFTGTVQQDVDTEALDGTNGSASYTFKVPAAGRYLLNAVVDAPNAAANSFFLEIDAQPQTPTMIWDIALTAGLETRTVSWRGNGTPDADQYAPKVFFLSQGIHQLIVRGREPGARVQSFAFVAYGDGGTSSGDGGTASGDGGTSSGDGGTASGEGGTTAPQWYVDPLAAGANTGTSWANAWTSPGAIDWTNVRAGDVLNLSGGASMQAYTQTLVVRKCGAANQPLTIRVGQDPGHDGLVAFGGAGINLNGCSYITVDGGAQGGHHIAISAVDTGIWGGTNGNVITGVDLDNVGMGIALNGTANDVHHNGVTNVNGGASVYAGIRVTGGADRFDTNRIHDNSIAILTSPTNGYGPDGIQASSGLSVYRNRISVSRAAAALATQEHPDSIQVQGANFLKIYANEFINVGDSVVQLGVWWSNAVIQDVWIFDNVFRIVTTVDAYPEYIRLYDSAGYNISAINNVKILNNTFADNSTVNAYCANLSGPHCPIRFNGYGGNPTAAGIEIKNNIFYNMGDGSIGPVIAIDDSTAFTPSSFAFANNVYFNPSAATYVRFRGTLYDTASTSWMATYEPSAKHGAPQFVSYAPFAAGNDFHLTSGDTAAKDSGVSFSFFDFDKDGTARPQGPAWDIGAYEVGP